MTLDASSGTTGAGGIGGPAPWVDISLHPRYQPRVLGHQSVLETLARAQDAGELPHALLFVGPRGVGKATLAWHIAKRLLLNTELAGDRLGPKGLSTVLNATHPDLWCVESGAGNDPESSINVDALRPLRGFLAQTRVGGGSRVVVIDALDAMNIFGFNALLKALEEPPPHTYFLLVAHHLAAVLPTIRSRCQVFRCHPLAAAEMVPILDQKSMSPLNQALARLCGAPGIVQRIMEEPDTPQRVTSLLGGIVTDISQRRPPSTASIKSLADSMKTSTLARYSATRYLYAGVKGASVGGAAASEEDASGAAPPGGIDLELWLNLWDNWSSLHHDVTVLSLDWFTGLMQWLRSSVIPNPKINGAN